MPLITAANIACGFHAGDPLVMRKTVRLAKQYGVKVGGHPGFPDRVGFGRRPMNCTPDEVYGDVLYQLGALSGICRSEGVTLHHVKLHGALYNTVNPSPELSAAVAAAVAGLDRSIIVYALPGSELQKAATAAGLRIAHEVFADRAYNEDGSLVSRRLPGAMITDDAVAEAHVARMVLEGQVLAITGKAVPVKVDTICVHGDNPHAVAFIRRMRQRLTAEGVVLAAPFSV